MSDERLRLLAREAIRNGRIPRTRPERMWGGSGQDNLCTICDGAVDQLGLDLEFSSKDGAVEYPVHVDCYAAWQVECQADTPEMEERVGVEPPSSDGRVAAQRT
jgi:hypothetical protein